MIRRLRVPLLALVVGLACLAAASARNAAPVRVLFIGNSYTYFHNLPEMFARLAAAAKRPVETRMVAPGGWRLKDHWEKGAGRQALAEGRWDYVVLQDQSTLGVTLYVEGKARASSDEVFRPFADRWAVAIKQAGARPAFYLTWARKASPEDQDTLTHAYMSAARASGALVAPVGLAWQRVRRQHPAIELFEPDGSHPSPTGSYLAACAFVAALLDQDPTGLPATVTGAPVDLETEQVQAGKTAVLAKLSPEEARALQQAAWAAWQEVKKNGGYVDAKPLAPGLAALPAPKPVSAASLAGTWTGTLLMHPSGPIEILAAAREGQGRMVRPPGFEVGEARVGRSDRGRRDRRRGTVRRGEIHGPRGTSRAVPRGQRGAGRAARDGGRRRGRFRRTVPAAGVVASDEAVGARRAFARGPS